MNLQLQTKHLKVKTFKDASDEDIQAWLSEHDVTIHHIEQSSGVVYNSEGCSFSCDVLRIFYVE